MTKGEYEGRLHVATESFQRFLGKLSFLGKYLENRLLPTEPEHILMRGIILNFQNLLENESEELINYYVHSHPVAANQRFKDRMDNGFMSFKSKFEWLYSKGLISNCERDVMEEIRVLRNGNIHARPSEGRQRFQYFGKPMLTNDSLKKIFVDIEKVLQKLRMQSGRESDWGTVPPGYASEMNWPQSAIDVFDKTYKKRLATRNSK